MSKLFLSAFVAVAAVAVAGVDYVNQARIAGSTPGAFSISDYTGTVQARFVSQQAALAAEKERNALLSADRRDHLPAAPEGWTRRDWDAAAEALLAKRYDMAKDTMLPDEIKEDPTLKALGALGKAAVAHKDATEVYVYEKPGALIALRLSLVAPAGSGGLAGMAMQMAANNIEAMSGKDGFAVVKGVTFREELGLFGAGAEERAYRVFTGEIGGRVRISVRAQAEDADILTLLSAIDYDRLNLMLDTPVAGIGSDAPELDPAETRALAEAQVSAAAAAQRQEAARQELRLQETALEFRRRKGGVSDEEYARIRSKLDDRAARIDTLVEAANGIGEPAEVVAAIAEASANPAVTAAPAQPASAPASGGLWGMISSVLGGGTAETGAEPAAAEVKVNRIGASNCTLSGGVKRCSVGGN